MSLTGRSEFVVGKLPPTSTSPKKKRNGTVRLDQTVSRIAQDEADVQTMGCPKHTMYSAGVRTKDGPSDRRRERKGRKEEEEEEADVDAVMVAAGAGTGTGSDARKREREIPGQPPSARPEQTAVANNKSPAAVAM